jgi:nucleoside-diphosphate-sugar epimerase
MKILITGADGFIGSHLTEALVRAGHDVAGSITARMMSRGGSRFFVGTSAIHTE